jgi:hypothetical protein
MTATTTAPPKRKPAARRKNRKKKTSGWIAWWPLALGIAVTPFAVKAATLMALTGPDGLRLLYPWMLLPKLHILGLSDALADSASQAMMYLQFPLYGVAAIFAHRWKGAGAAILVVALLHVLAVAWLFAAGRG